jgi:hypothetical protein
MRCPYLGKTESAEGIQECHAREWTFEPSSSEIDAYCTTRLHRWCPLYRALRAVPTAYRAGKGRRELQKAVG